jgi:L,D-transpeptidase catalytic domain
VAAALPVVSAGTARAGPTVARVQDLAVLLADKTARSTPSVHAAVTGRVSALRPITDGPTALPIYDRTTDSSGRRWLLVGLPGRPNSRTGWITAARTTRRRTGWHIVVFRSTRRAVVYHLGEVVRRFRVIVGKPATPTPSGSFFIEEVVREPRSFPGAPYAMALSARSAAFSEFAGGPGQIALHGVRNLGGRLGTAVSHGCVRFGEAADAWLGRRMEAGVPVDILA